MMTPTQISSRKTTHCWIIYLGRERAKIQLNRLIVWVQFYWGFFASKKAITNILIIKVAHSFDVFLGFTIIFQSIWCDATWVAAVIVDSWNLIGKVHGKETEACVGQCIWLRKKTESRISERLDEFSCEIWIDWTLLSLMLLPFKWNHFELCVHQQQLTLNGFLNAGCSKTPRTQMLPESGLKRAILCRKKRKVKIELSRFYALSIQNYQLTWSVIAINLWHRELLNDLADFPSKFTLYKVRSVYCFTMDWLSKYIWNKREEKKLGFVEFCHFHHHGCSITATKQRRFEFYKLEKIKREQIFQKERKKNWWWGKKNTNEF